MMNAKILICYNSPVSIFPIYNGKPVLDQDKTSLKKLPVNDLSETSFSNEIVRIKKCLQEYFTEVKTFAVDSDLERTINKLNSFFPDAILNFVESVEGIASYECYMAGLFELLGFEFTGNPPASLGNCLNKLRTKNILRSFGISTPNALTFTPGTKISEENFTLKFPVILKLLNEDASIGISEFSVVNDFSKLKKHIRFLFSNYRQEVIAEEYIDGRELNVAILGGKILPVSEIRFNGLPDHLPKIVTYDGKWIEDSIYYDNTRPQCPAILDKKTKKKVEDISLLAYEAMNCRDYARIDIRLDKNNYPFVIEVNPNPDISTDSGFARAASAAGMSYSELLLTITNYALARKEQNDQKNKAS